MERLTQRLGRRPKNRPRSVAEITPSSQNYPLCEAEPPVSCVYRRFWKVTPANSRPNQLCASPVHGLYLIRRFPKGNYMAVGWHADSGNSPTTSPKRKPTTWSTPLPPIQPAWPSGSCSRPASACLRDPGAAACGPPPGPGAADHRGPGRLARQQGAQGPGGPGAS